MMEVTASYCKTGIALQGTAWKIAEEGEKAGMIYPGSLGNF
ncbi:MAG: hypothetical protein ABIN99_12490 [Nitrosospira sp.]